MSLFFLLLSDALHINPVAEHVEAPAGGEPTLNEARDPLLKVAWIDKRAPGAHEEVALIELEVKAPARGHGESRIRERPIELSGCDIFRGLYRFSEEMFSDQSVVARPVEEVHNQSPFRL